MTVISTRGRKAAAARSGRIHISHLGHRKLAHSALLPASVAARTQTGRHLAREPPQATIGYFEPPIHLAIEFTTGDMYVDCCTSIMYRY